MFDQVEKNAYGFHQIKDIPSREELKEYYANKYYQGEEQYQHEYTQEEKDYTRNKIEQKFIKINELLGDKAHGKLRLLDVGCGEGWTLKYFDEQGWDVMGSDFSRFGVETHNPQLIDQIRQGDLEDTLQALINEGEQFDVVWLDNVLEHVREPLEMIKMCNQLATDHGILLIEVPNDFSALQMHLIENKMISKPFWIAPPDHLSYFNQAGLDALCADAGWKCLCNMCDYPIDLFLLSENTNYVEKPEIGRACHMTRVATENFMHAHGAEKVNKYYEAMADLGLGREIIAYYGKS